MDRRVYNGCLSDDLRKELDLCASLFQAIKRIEPDACCTYFPAEEKYHVHAWEKPLSGFYNNKIDALRDALSKLTA